MAVSRNRKAHKKRSKLFSSKIKQAQKDRIKKRNEQYQQAALQKKTRLKMETAARVFRLHQEGKLTTKTNQVEVARLDFKDERIDLSGTFLRHEIMPIFDDYDNGMGVAEVKIKGDRIIANLHLESVFQEVNIFGLTLFPVIAQVRTNQDAPEGTPAEFGYEVYELRLAAAPHLDKRIGTLGQQKGDKLIKKR